MASAREYFRNKKNRSNEVFQKKLFQHKVAVFYRIILICIILGTVAAGIYFYLQNKVYKNYRVVSTVERSETLTTQYADFEGKILKYSMDGASYTDENDKKVWNETYQIKNPILDICENYAAIADQGGTTVYVFNTEGKQAEIQTSYPIVKVRVANQGVVYVLVENGTVSYIDVYDLEGNSLAHSKQSMESSGYPLDFDVAADGKKLAVSYLYVDSGVMTTNIAFYNFGSVGQEEIDNLVSGYSYDGIVYPEVHFVDSNHCVAVGDDRITYFQGSQKPDKNAEVTFEEEIKSAFCCGEYVLLVFDSSESSNPYRLEVYDMTGQKVLTKEFSMNYNEIKVVDNSILIIGDQEFSVLNWKGKEKFHYTSEKNLLYVAPSDVWNRYILIDSANTEVIALKF